MRGKGDTVSDSVDMRKKEREVKGSLVEAGITRGIGRVIAMTTGCR